MATISPFELYIIMQADSFLAMLPATGFLAFVLFGISSLIKFAVHVEQDAFGFTKLVKVTNSVSGLLLLLVALASLFMPNTKTLSVMYGVPALLNTKTVKGLDSKIDRSLESVVKFLEKTTAK